MAICTICSSNKSKLYITLDHHQKMIYECSNCKNAFTYPPPEPVAYDEDDFHGQFNFNNVEELPSQWKKAIIKQTKLIKEFIPTGSKILEIGCGYGLLLEQLKNNKYKTYGIEPSKVASSIGKSKGLEILNGYFPQTTFTSVNFDLIIMSQVLEHIEKPLEFLTSLSKMYPGKYLLLVQSNYKGIVPRKNKKVWYAWVPDQHYSHFTSSGLKKICKMLKLECIRIEYSTLEHGGYWLSKVSEIIPNTADQLHCIIKL